MIKVILNTTLKIICPLTVAYSIYILLRGHNEPGGGFIGGLMFALAGILWLMRDTKSISPHSVLNSFPFLLGGLVLFLLSVVLFPVMFGEPVLKGLWTSIWVPISGKFSSVLVFDVGIYLVVALCAIFSYVVLAERTGKGR